MDLKKNTHIRFDDTSDCIDLDKSTNKEKYIAVSELNKMNPISIKTNLRKRKQHQKCRQNRTKNKKRGRIIVRNLPFKSTEDNLKKHFEQYGPVSEVKLLKKPDGKLVGCGFIQYEIVQNAAKALFNLSGKPFLGRDIICDWAQGQDSYIKNMQEAFCKEYKSEEDTIEIKEEPDNDVDSTNVPDAKEIEIKQEIDTGNDEILEKNAEDDGKSDKSESSVENETSESEDEPESEEIVDEVKEPEIKRPRIFSNDVQEGKTVFIKNVPFSATNGDLLKCMRQFGPVCYALICVDKLTEYSKGTAFVKFENLEDAEKCLAAGTELTLLGNILDCHKAISKSDMEQKNAKPEIKRDSRHLYLIKEGVILAGTKAAQGVSASDMAKRLELERWKTQILRNLNMFISLYRLIIHNLPPTYDDKQLRALFAKHAGPKAVIKEAKVMLDLKQMGPDAKPISKEYGFVSFEKHEDALKALRSINNNPNIFTRTKRPIVAFSIENKSVINAKTKRLTKSRVNNPKCKEYDPAAIQTDKQTKSHPQNISATEFSGVAAKPGLNKLRSRYKLTNQAQLHHENLKQEKRRMKLTRKSLKKKKVDYLKQAKQKKSKKNQQGSDNLSKIVNKYTKTANKFNKSAKKHKWYES